MSHKYVFNVKLGTAETAAQEAVTIAMQAEVTKAALMERERALSMEEVSRLLIEQMINSVELDDNTALRAKEYYPAWKNGTAYTAGWKLRHGGKLWKVRQAHTSQEGWEPGTVGTESLFEEVCESHEGTLDDPIPYAGNMELLAGLYYCQDYTVYKCTRATEQAVYHKLSELVGTYVEPG